MHLCRAHRRAAAAAAHSSTHAPAPPPCAATPPHAPPPPPLFTALLHACPHMLPLLPHLARHNLGVEVEVRVGLGVRIIARRGLLRATPLVLNLRRAPPCRRRRRCAALLHARSRMQRSSAPSHLYVDPLLAGHLAH
eukprot:scaffold22126_cov70-Phaeocystis_antarctica.AAC.9